MKEKIDLVKLWIKKAENDLITAKHSLTISPEPPFDTICFHAQQCAEKYLKAFLTYYEIPFEKTHNLPSLIELATKRDETFNQIIEIGEFLMPYAVEIRYPSKLYEELTLEQAKDAIEMAIKIKEFILTRLSLANDKND